jgi:hypothetical protein
MNIDGTDYADKVNWESAIGKCFLSFGTVEYLIYNFHQFISKDDAPRFISSLPLSKRIELLSELLNQHSFRELDFSPIKVDLDETKKLSETRNLIAHNPLMFEFYESEPGAIKIVQTIVSIKNRSHKITLSELDEFSKNAHSLVERLNKSTRETMELIRLLPK